MDPDEPLDTLVERHITELVREYIADFRITLVNGPRQAGKTTLMRQLHRDLGGAFVTFDDDDQRSAARDDARGYLQELPRPLFIDEVQRAGDPFVLAMKAEVDRRPRPGTFILSGSSRFLTVPTLSESLAGRIGLVDLWPFSVAERIGAQPDFLERIFAEPASVLRTTVAPMTRHEYLRLACTGGFPEVVELRSSRTRSGWFQSYLTTVIQREVAELAEIRRMAVLPRLVRLLAASTAQELNYARIAQDMGIDAETVRNYVALLETVYLVQLLPAWSKNLNARVKRRPKIHMTDTGLAAWLRDQNADSLTRPANSAAAGALFETFVINELVKLRSVSDLELTLSHYQDYAGSEVDCVMETNGGQVAATEIKAAATARAEDFKHLKRLRDQLGPDFVAGIVFFAGPNAVPFGDRLFALPVSLLWGGARPQL